MADLDLSVWMIPHASPARCPTKKQGARSLERSERTNERSEAEAVDCRLSIVCLIVYERQRPIDEDLKSQEKKFCRTGTPASRIGQEIHEFPLFSAFQLKSQLWSA